MATALATGGFPTCTLPQKLGLQTWNVIISPEHWHPTFLYNLACLLAFSFKKKPRGQKRGRILCSVRCTSRDSRRDIAVRKGNGSNSLWNKVKSGTKATEGKSYQSRLIGHPLKGNEQSRCKVWEVITQTLLCIWSIGESLMVRFL